MLRVTVLAVALLASAVQDQAPTAKPFAIRAHRYAFEPARIEVNQDDLVKIELRTSDIAHSFTIDEYKIAKRVRSGQPVTFESRTLVPEQTKLSLVRDGEEGPLALRDDATVSARGELDDLPGAGRPLELHEPDAALPAELRLALRMLRNRVADTKERAERVKARQKLLRYFALASCSEMDFFSSLYSLQPKKQSLSSAPSSSFALATLPTIR